MKILIDMNLTPRWADVLTYAGYEAVHWSTVGNIKAPDHELVHYAIENDLIIFTHDLDFSAILAATRGHKPSVVQIRGDDVRPEAVASQVIAALKQMDVELEAGALLTIDTRRTRLRLLPL